MTKIRKLPDLSFRLSDLDRNTVNLLLNPLLRLRQSCCHPQAVRGQFMALQKSTMTMEQLLEQMTKKVNLECEEYHRQVKNGQIYDKLKFSVLGYYTSR